MTTVICPDPCGITCDHAAPHERDSLNKPCKWGSCPECVETCGHPDCQGHHCPGCGGCTDPGICWCGSSKSGHPSDHGFVPLGCTCHLPKRPVCTCPDPANHATIAGSLGQEPNPENCLKGEPK